MPEYLLSVFGDEAEFAKQQADTELITRMYAQVDEFNQRLQKAGAWVFAGGLHPTSSATVVRGSKDADALMTDGPYIEGKEHIGGFLIVRADDLDGALDWAHKVARVITLPIEVRPFQGEVGG